MSKINKISALNEMEGVEKPEIFSATVALHIKNFRKKEINVQELVLGILKGNKVALSRAITLIESTKPEHIIMANEIINGCLPYANQSVRIGITGVPGVGKSTFIEAFGLHLTGLEKKVAVLAIDPSSTITRGSILGDKTRMEDLVKQENAYIRPSAAGESLGGVAQKTRETIILCEAAGFDTIIIETVGVGQSETAVHSMVDYFLLLKIAGAGDELQGIKRGIMEMADAIVINKADGDNVSKANLAKVEFGRALQLFPVKKSGWLPNVSTCSAITKNGVAEIWTNIEKYLKLTTKNNYFIQHRALQNEYWLTETINNKLKNSFYNDEIIADMIPKIKKQVLNNEITPFDGAEKLMKLFKK